MQIHSSCVAASLPVLVAAALLTQSLPATQAADPAPKVANRAETGSEAKPHPLDAPLELARASLKALDAVKDYEAIFIKKEMVNGIMYPHHMRLKHRLSPFSVYMLYLKMHQGREVIYVEGQNNGNLVAHETGIAGLIGAIQIAPNSPQAMAEGTNPITRIGMPKMVEGIIDQWERERPYGADEIEVKYYPNAKLGDRACQVIESKYLAPRKHFKYHMSRLYLDKETNFPVRIEQYGFPPTANGRPPLVGEWTYKDIKANVGLKDIDFDVRNPSYNF